MESLVDRVTT